MRILLIGLHKDEFWELNLAEFERCLKGYRDRLHAQMKMNDNLNFVFGQYIIAAVHSPKKYPKEPATERKERRQQFVATTGADRARIAKLLHGKN